MFGRICSAGPVTAFEPLIAAGDRLTDGEAIVRLTYEAPAEWREATGRARAVGQMAGEFRSDIRFGADPRTDCDQTPTDDPCRGKPLALLALTRHHQSTHRLHGGRTIRNRQRRRATARECGHETRRNRAAG